MPNLVSRGTGTAILAGPTPSAEAWFAGGERVGYDPKARAIVRAQSAPLNVFLRREGSLAHAVSFLPGYPDGSFGWAKVLPHLPNAAEMPKLFVEYVGMGDSDKPKNFPYSTVERTSSKRSGAISGSDQRHWSLLTFPHSSSWSTFDADWSAPSGASPQAVRRYAGFSSSMAGSSRTGTPIRGTRRRSCAAYPTVPAGVRGAPLRCSR